MAATQLTSLPSQNQARDSNTSPFPSPSELDYDNPQHVSEREDIPPNGGYGWVCVACVLMINAHTWGINSVCIPQSIL